MPVLDSFAFRQLQRGEIYAGQLVKQTKGQWPNLIDIPSSSRRGKVIWRCGRYTLLAASWKVERNISLQYLLLFFGSETGKDTVHCSGAEKQELILWQEVPSTLCSF